MHKIPMLSRYVLSNVRHVGVEIEIGNCSHSWNNETGNCGRKVIDQRVTFWFMLMRYFSGSFCKA